jgi:glycine dehydrogenase
MLRYIKRLESKDLSLCHSMISLGSCTMKLNATSEMMPVTWPEFAAAPLRPAEQARGYTQLFRDWKTGWQKSPVSPHFAAAERRFARRIRRAAGHPRYHHSRGEGHRTICLIPTSAHGTNPASAVMCGMKVVGCLRREGNIDVWPTSRPRPTSTRQPRLPDGHLSPPPTASLRIDHATSAP